MRRRVATVTVTALLSLVPLSAASAASSARAAVAGGAATSVSVVGTVAAPSMYTAEQVRALPQVTAPLAERRRPGTRTVTGASLLAVIQTAAPVLPAAKNASLRVAVTARGFGGRAVTLALGELDPSFGAHDALLVAARRGNRIDLVVPGDRDEKRTVLHLDQLGVTVSTATTSETPAGGLTVRDGGRTVRLTAAQLATLPARTRTVSFMSGTTPQQLTETGPPLSAVLLRAGVLSTPSTSVAAAGSDGYVAVVTPAEATTGGRPLLVSTSEDGAALARPRLVVDGDVKGGRYVSEMTDLVVSRH